jgi:hypothetical protein
MMKQEDILRLHREALVELKKVRGVLSVGYGLRERRGQVTRDVAFRVYVRKKKPRRELSMTEIVPAAFKGIPTDVLEENWFVPDDCADHQKHGTLGGGINILSYKRKADQTREAGTLGFFATIDGEDGPKNVVAITNNHVLGLAGESVGDYVYQPPWIQDLTHTFKPAPLDDAEALLLHAPPGTPTAGTPIGKIWALPDRKDYPYTYQGESQADYYLDCAAVQLAICISSLCHTNCSGFDFSRMIPGLNLNHSDDVMDIDRVKHEDIGTPRALVYKVGALTGRSTGEVIEVTAGVTDGTIHGHNAMKINATARDCNGSGTLRFSDQGDSGSAVLNGDGKIVGLLFGHDTTDITKSYASHIHPVLATLKVTAITQAHPLHGNKASVEARADMPLMISGRPNQAFQLREKFIASAEGRRMLEMVEQHRPEVAHLVNHNRRVMVAWHRNKGPAFLNRAMNNARDPEERIPREIEGVTRRVLLGNMAEALSEHGSLALRKAVIEHRETILSFAEECGSLHELVDRLAERQLV